MKTATFQPLIRVLGAGALVAAAGTLSADQIILDEAVNDYSPVSQASFNNPPQSTETGYRTEIVLDESYHDYDGAAAMAFNENLDELEQTEIAAFEYGGTVGKERQIPWDLQALD